MAKSYIQGQAATTDRRTQAAQRSASAVHEDRTDEDARAGGEYSAATRRTRPQRPAYLLAHPDTTLLENDLPVQGTGENGGSANGTSVGGRAAEASAAADTQGPDTFVSGVERGELYPLLLEAAKSWCRQTFVTAGSDCESDSGAVSHTGFRVIQADCDADLPWLTKKGAPRKQPPAASYELRLGKLDPAALAEAIRRAPLGPTDASGGAQPTGSGNESHDPQPRGADQIAAFARAVADLDGPCWLARIRLDRYGRPVAGSYDLCAPAWAVSRAIEAAGSDAVLRPARFAEEIAALRRRLEHQISGEQEPRDGRLSLADIDGWISRATADCGLFGAGLPEGGLEPAFELLRGEEPDQGGAGEVALSEVALPDVDPSGRMELLASLYERACGRGALAAYVGGRRGAADHEASTPARGDGGPAGPRLALSARRIPAGRWTTFATLTEHPPGTPDVEADGEDGTSAPEDSPHAREDSSTLAAVSGAVTLPEGALAASRAALGSLPSPGAAVSTSAGAALHRFGLGEYGADDGSKPHCGEPGRGSADYARECAREVAAGAVVERARRLAALEDPARAFGLHPPVGVYTQSGTQSGRSSMTVWTVPGCVSKREVLLRTAGATDVSTPELALPSPEDTRDGASGQEGSEQEGSRRTGRLLPGVLALDDSGELARRVEELAAGLDERAGEIIHNSHARTDGAATERQALLEAFEAACERFSGRLRTVEEALTELRKLEDDVRLRPQRQRYLAELDEQLRTLREDFAEAYAQFEEDGADLERSDSALHYAQVHLETVEASRPNIAHRMVAPVAERRWAAELEAARGELKARAERAAADNRRYEQSQDDCKELNEAVMDAARRRRQHAARLSAADDRIRAGVHEVPALGGVLNEKPPERAAEAGLWPLTQLEAGREALFDAALEVHEMFVISARRYIVDNLRCLCRLLEDTTTIERSADEGGRAPLATEMLATELLRSAALVAPVLELSTPEAAGLLRRARAGSVGVFIDCLSESGPGDGPEDALRLSGLQAAAVGLIGGCKSAPADTGAAPGGGREPGSPVADGIPTGDGREVSG